MFNFVVLECLAECVGWGILVARCLFSRICIISCQIRRMNLHIWRRFRNWKPALAPKIPFYLRITVIHLSISRYSQTGGFTNTFNILFKCLTLSVLINRSGWSVRMTTLLPIFVHGALISGQLRLTRNQVQMKDNCILDKVGQFLWHFFLKYRLGLRSLSQPRIWQLFLFKQPPAASRLSDQLRQWNQRGCKGYRLYYQPDPLHRPSQTCGNLTERLFLTHFWRRPLSNGQLGLFMTILLEGQFILVLPLTIV
jgi:hypothetical protein